MSFGVDLYRLNASVGDTFWCFYWVIRGNLNGFFNLILFFCVNTSAMGNLCVVGSS